MQGRSINKYINTPLQLTLSSKQQEYSKSPHIRTYQNKNSDRFFKAEKLLVVLASEPNLFHKSVSFCSTSEWQQGQSNLEHL